MIAEPPIPASAPASTSNPWWKWVTPAVLALAAAVVFGFMRPDQILIASTPTGGDMGAHVLLPAYLRDQLLPSGRILGWSMDWYAGFPVFYFYFPLPALAIVLLDLALPYGVAFKLVTVAGLVALPLASYYLARCLAFSKPVALVAGVAGGTFIFMESFSIFGGNTLSTLAGEYSFSWSFALSMVYLGMLVKNVHSGRGFSIGPGVVLALTAMSHIITTGLIILATIPLLFRKKGPSAVLGSWALGFGIAAFWAVPLLARVGLTSDMGWFPVEGIDKVFPRELWPLVVLAAAGLVWSVARRHPISPVVAMLILPVAGYYVIQFIDYRKLYNARLLPYWYYFVHLLAGIAVGAAVVAIARRLRGGDATRWIAAGAAAIFFLVAGIVGIQRTPYWAAWNYEGYEGKQEYALTGDGEWVLHTDRWAEYQGLMQELDTLPPGRVMWEANNDMNRYGTPMALMLTGYWSEGHPSMEGLLFESSLTTPFHFLNASEVSQRPSNPVSGLEYRGMNFDRAIRHLDVYGVEYYVSYTETARGAAEEYGLEVLAESPPFTVFALPETQLVEAGAFIPAVWDGDASFYDAALEWYDDVNALDRWLVETGPSDWPRIDDVATTARPRILEAGTITNISVEDHRIEFDTTAVGVPHLVKVSYFPNWQADGADGPYRAAPSLMVVVPTQEHVVISFSDTWAEMAGKWLTALTLIGLLAMAVRRRLRGPEPGVTGNG
ncbi:MAG TPA: hypothetical protein VK960_06810 [Acidimicrobiia bacterium]|nr:hypothetical protein [Acidimicrobiia bacterium]